MRAAAARPGERMTLTADDPAGFDRAWIEFVRRPGGGVLTISVDGGPPVRVSTAGATEGVAIRPLAVAPHSRSLALSTRGGPVELLSWGTERARPGTTYANFGTIGATIDITGRWTPAVVAAEMARLRPALVLIAFGTNEGFKAATDPAAYRADYAARLDALRAAAPDAAFVTIGPPDGERELHAEAGGPPQCVFDRASAQRLSGPVWTAPPNLVAVRDAERAVALDAGAFFWDWSAAMGGPCSLHAWTLRRPPWGNADHVHLRAPGYRATAERLFATLMEGYRQYRARHPAHRR
jgi:lysophospholipase L1-like esterase